MGEWSAWAGCSRECGGGDQYRTRAVLRSNMHSGVVCGETAETRACNIEACRTDCVLSDWTAWGPCSKRCLWESGSLPGHAYRSRLVKEAASSLGSCPSEESRRQYRECNPYVCPADLAELKCTAEQDIIALLDGSGSLSSSTGEVDKNFKDQKSFVQKLIEHSSMSGDSGNVKQVRYGLVLFGGSGQPKVLSPLTGDSAGLVSKLSSADWPKGESPVAAALQTASQLLQIAGGEPGVQAARHTTVLLLTDGRLQHPLATAGVAKRLREKGARVLIALVQDTGDVAAASTQDTICRLASTPCSDHVLRVDRWEDLSPQLGRFLAALCPVAFSA